MKIIDIRGEEEHVSIIRFADGEEFCSAVELETLGAENHVYINSASEARSGRNTEDGCVLIDSEEDARNLIKAIEKAISLEWWGK